MKSKLQPLFFILGFILILVAFVITSTLLKKAKNVPDNEIGTIGNSAGNLYNGGLFCEHNGVTYFSNPYDKGNLYAMDLGQTNIRCISSGDISQINIGGNNLYFYVASTNGEAGLGYIRNERGIYRCDLSGKNITALAPAISDSVLLVDSNIYYTNFNSGEDNNSNADISVHRMDLNGKNNTDLFHEHIRLGSAYAQQIYYAGVDKDHNLHAFNTLYETTEQVLDIYMYLPIVSGGNIYFLDLKDDYHLKAYSMGDGSIRDIVTERVDTYNIYNSVIYYQNTNPEEYALKRVYTDGTGLEVVKYGVFHNINITSEFVYFTDYNASVPVYMTPTNGSINVTTFDAAMEATMKN